MFSFSQKSGFPRKLTFQGRWRGEYLTKEKSRASFMHFFCQMGSCGQNLPNIIWQCPLQINRQFNLVFVVLRYLEIILKVITIDWRSSESLLYSTKEGEVSNKIDEFFASLIKSIFSTRVVCGKGILWRAVRAENAYWQINMFQIQMWLWYEYWVNLYMGFRSDPGFIVGTWNCQNC